MARNRVGPEVVGVPLYTLFGWTGTIYAAFRVALLATDGWTAVVVAGVLAISCATAAVATPFV